MKTNQKSDNSCFENNIGAVRPDQAVRRPFCKIFLIDVKAPRDLRNKSDWFHFAEVEIFELQL